MGLSFPFHNGNDSFFRYRSRLQDWGVVGRVVLQPLSSDVVFLDVGTFLPLDSRPQMDFGL